jgi:hypothetical protein
VGLGGARVKAALGRGARCLWVRDDSPVNARGSVQQMSGRASGRPWRAARGTAALQWKAAEASGAIEKPAELGPRLRCSALKGVEAPGARALDSWPVGLGCDGEGRREQLGAKVCGQGRGLRHGARRRSDVGYGGLLEEARLVGASVKAVEFRGAGALDPR